MSNKKKKDKTQQLTADQALTMRARMAGFHKINDSITFPYKVGPTVKYISAINQEEADKQARTKGWN